MLNAVPSDADYPNQVLNKLLSFVFPPIFVSSIPSKSNLNLNPVKISIDPPFFVTLSVLCCWETLLVASNWLAFFDSLSPFFKSIMECYPSYSPSDPQKYLQKIQISLDTYKIHNHQMVSPHCESIIFLHK